MTWIHVRGNPAPQGSKQAFVRGRSAVLVETSKRLPAWRIAVQDAALQHLTPIPAGVPVAVEIVFVMPRTKAMGNRPAPPMVQRPDADKLARAVLDGLTGPAFADDSQVVRLVVDKRRADPGEETGARIHVEALEPPHPQQGRRGGANASRRPQITPANTTTAPKEPHAMPHPDPCAACRIRDHWCCDPWETPQDHEGETE